MKPTPQAQGDRGSAERAGAATLTDFARYTVELAAIRDAMAALAPSRLADTSAWVQASWAVAQAEGALSRAASGWWMAPSHAADLADAVRTAWAALHDLEALGQGLPRWR